MKIAPNLIVGLAVVSIGVAGAPACRANPPKFPDISNYTPVNPQEYIVELPNPGRSPLQSTYFLTPDGITCSVRSGVSAGCTGNNFPSVPPVANDPARGLEGANWIGTDIGLKQTGDPIRQSPAYPFKTLPPFHSITIGGVTCGVDDKKTTACKDPQGQGFVLSPQGSGWLEHI